jgi:PAS domain-containing protein
MPDRSATAALERMGRITDELKSQIALLRGDVLEVSDMARDQADLCEALQGAEDEEEVMHVALEYSVNVDSMERGVVHSVSENGARLLEASHDKWINYTEEVESILDCLRQPAQVIFNGEKSVPECVGASCGVATPMMLRGELMAVISVFSSAVPSPSAATLSMLMTVADRSAYAVRLLRAKEEISVAMDKLTALSLASNEAVAVVRRGRVLAVNRAYEELVGVPAFSMEGSRAEELFDESARAEAVKRLREGPPAGFQSYLFSEGSPVEAYVRLSAVEYDGDEEPALAVVATRWVERSEA